MVKGNTIDVLLISEYNIINGRMFYIKLKSEMEREKLVSFLKMKVIESASRYQALHTSIAGVNYGEFFGDDIVATRDSKRILRLPLHMNLQIEDIEFIVSIIKEFYEKQ